MIQEGFDTILDINAYLCVRVIIYRFQLKSQFRRFLDLSATSAHRFGRSEDGVLKRHKQRLWAVQHPPQQRNA